MSLKNKQWQRADEPVFWGLFGAGGVVAAYLTPALMLITGILVPLGMMEGYLSYENVMAFAQHWFGKLVIVTVVALPMWNASHRLYHAMHDFQIHKGMTFFKWFWYGLATVVTIMSITYLVIA